MAQMVNHSWVAQWTQTMFREVLSSNVSFAEALMSHRKQLLRSQPSEVTKFDRKLGTPIDFSNSRDDEDDSTDLTLRLSDGDVKVHKLLFTNASSYFK